MAAQDVESPQSPQAVPPTSPVPAAADGSATPRSPGSTKLTSAMGLGKQGTTISWSGMSVVAGAGTDSEKVVLKEVSGRFRPGELVALVGPSGAGKSTFLNALAGRSPGVQVNGDVKMDGVVLDAEQRRKRAAYVMQEDALIITQTPREVLEFAAALRLGISDDTERAELVEACLELLGLLKCADHPVGSSVEASDKGRVSGGEKKRTAIAQELLSRPAVVFLDEPTTGLDSHSAKHLVTILRELARQGVAVVATVHQPSSETFALFDRVVMLRSGELVYDGPVPQVPSFFAAAGHQMPPRSNPCDYAMLMLQRLPIEELRAMATVVTPKSASLSPRGTPPVAGAELTPWSAPDDDDDTPRPREYVEVRAGVWTQFKWLIDRDVKHILRDPSAVKARFGGVLMLCLIGGMLFLNNGKEWGNPESLSDVNTAIQSHFGVVFFTGMNCLFQNAMPPLVAFLPERPVFVREYASRTYSVLAYATSKIVVEFVQICITVALGHTILYFMAGLQGSFLLSYLYWVLLGASASSIALCIGVVSPNADVAANTLPLMLSPQVLFSGFFVSTETMPVWIRWIQHTCTMKYAINLVMLTEFDAANVPADRLNQTQELLDRSDISDSAGAYALYIGVLVGSAVLFRVLAVHLLRRNVKQAYE